jgi:hypothetical protein
MAGTSNPRIEIHDFHPQGLPSAVVTKGSAALLFHAAAARLPSRSLRDFLSAALKILVTAAVQADPAARAHLYGPRLRLARH